MLKNGAIQRKRLRIFIVFFSLIYTRVHLFIRIFASENKQTIIIKLKRNNYEENLYSYRHRYDGSWCSGTTLNNKTYGTSFVVKVVDDVAKFALDGNKSWFGTSADDAQQFTHRLKSGAKSQTAEGKRNQLELTIPSAGKLTVYPRTGSNSATDRNMVITQSGETLYDAVVEEANAIKVDLGEKDDEGNPKQTNLYPGITVDVVAGTVIITHPNGSMNYYAFEFVEGTTGIKTMLIPVENENAPMYNLAGQQVDKNFKGVVIQNGKKFINK